MNNSKIKSGQPIMDYTFDYVPDGILMQNKSGSICYVNPKLCSLLGYTAEELIGLTHKEAAKVLLDLESIDFNTIQKTFKEVLKGKSFATRRKLKHRQGYYVPVQQYINPVSNDKGEIIGSMFIFRDLHHELLFEISHAINSSLNIEKIIRTAINAVIEHLSILSSAIFLYDKKKQKLQLVACNTMAEDKMKDCSHKLGSGAPGIIAAEKRPIYIRDLKTDPLIHEKAREFLSHSSSIGFPLISQGELLGVMAFDAFTVRDFTPQELFIFESITNQLAMAIHNARLYNITKKLSITDGLTGLYNHQYFQKRLEEEIKRANRNNNPLSLLMIDLDYFKEVNDHFGHPEGDKILKKIAEILKHNTRSNDIISRYGGEEFTVILTDCTKESAVVFSERIRAAIQHLNVGKEGVFRLTASAGIATYPEDADNKKDLIEVADVALYKAKRFKNKVCLFKE